MRCKSKWFTGGIIMGIKEKIAKAKKVNWIADEMPNYDVKTTIELAKISAKIEMARLDKKMTQKEFAEYMGVTQGMVSKWESREYNFTIKSLNEICEKLNIELDILFYDSSEMNNYNIVSWNNEIDNMEEIPSWFKGLYSKEAIA